MSPPRIAYLCPCSPWPTTFGGALRVEALWGALRGVGQVHLAVIGERPGLGVRRRLRGEGARIFPPRREKPLERQVRLVQALLTDRCIPAARYLSPRRLDRLSAWLSAIEPDVIVFGDEYLACLLPLAARRGARTIIDTMNAASRGHWRVVRAGGSPLTRFQYACLAVNTARMERRFFPQADQVWAVSEDDAAFYAQVVGDRVRVVPNVVDVPETPPGAGEPGTVMLSGSYSYRPSEDAALRLIRLAAPLIAEGSVRRLLLVGREPTVRMRTAAAGKTAVEITGPVPEVAPYLGSAAVFAAPIAAGSGTKLKVLEAMACARAVITTPLGAEGIAIRPGVHAEVVSLDGFVPALRRLLADPDGCAALGRAGRALVQERYSRAAMAAAVAPLLRGPWNTRT